MDWEEGKGAEICELFYLDIFLVAEEQYLVPAGFTSQGTEQELHTMPWCGPMPKLSDLLLAHQMQRLKPPQHRGMLVMWMEQERGALL